MPPETHSQTAHSRAPMLGTLQEGVRDLSIEYSSEANPRAPREEKRAGAEVPTKTRKITLSVSRRQGAEALDTDPNHGRCLLTNRPSAVQLCHIIPNATEDETLNKLEYVWEIGHKKLDLHTSRNLMHLRADWHFLFNQGAWVLIPELGVLQKVNKIYLKDKHTTSNLTKLFLEPPRTYNYYVLPTPALQEPICRFALANGPDGLELGQQEHETHFPPFPQLGPLRSHILPHFVIFNTGSKLDNMARSAPSTFTNMIISLTQIVTLAPLAASVAMIQHLYETWMDVKVPDHFNAAGTSNRSNSQSEAGRDDASHGGRPRRDLRRATKSHEEGSQASGGGYAEGQQRAIHPFQSSEDDESVTDDTVMDDSTDWIEYIHKWRNEDESVMEKQGPNMVDDAGDEQLVAYINEHARTPPSPGAWDRWKSDWDVSKSRYPTASDRSRFSSNDWAVFKHAAYLTRPGYPRPPE